jgi:hypothetical protein
MESKMSRSKKDQRGKRIDGEITTARVIGDKLVRDTWEERGGPRGKRSAKREKSRASRRVDKKIVESEL